MNTYSVTAKRAGTIIGTIKVTALDALQACAEAEKQLKSKPRRLQLGENGKTKIVEWTGLDFEARRVVTVWDKVVDILATGVEAGPGQEMKVAKAVTLWRRKGDDRICLIYRNGRVVTSKPIAAWGKDFSKPAGGTWKLTHNARQVYEEFAAKAKGPVSTH